MFALLLLVASASGELLLPWKLGESALEASPRNPCIESFIYHGYIGQSATETVLVPASSVFSDGLCLSHSCGTGDAEFALDGSATSDCAFAWKLRIKGHPHVILSGCDSDIDEFFYLGKCDLLGNSTELCTVTDSFDCYARLDPDRIRFKRSRSSWAITVEGNGAFISETVSFMTLMNHDESHLNLISYNKSCDIHGHIDDGHHYHELDVGVGIAIVFIFFLIPVTVAAAIGISGTQLR